MHYWLVKSEPEAYSFADLQRDKKTDWDGVRNFQAAANMKAMQLGDRCFFYHSVSEKQIEKLIELAVEQVGELEHQGKTNLIPDRSRIPLHHAQRWLPVCLALPRFGKHAFQTGNELTGNAHLVGDVLLS